MRNNEGEPKDPNRFRRTKKVAKVGAFVTAGAVIGAAGLGISQKFDNATTERANSFTKTSCDEGKWERVPFGGITVYERTQGEPQPIPGGTDVCVTDKEVTKVKGRTTKTITIIDKNGTRYTGESFLAPQER